MPKNHPELTAERLRELLSYDPETGVFRRLISTSSNARAGDVAGFFNDQGYRLIRINNRQYRAHRLAWLYVHGRWPADQLDHINGVRDANWIANLREATQFENQQNLPIRGKNTSGHPGASWHAGDRKWHARIRAQGKLQFLGSFDSPEDAGRAYAEAKAAIHQFNPFVRTS